MWYYESAMYQMYPLGQTGAPLDNDGIQAHRINELKNYIPHLVKLGIGAVYFSPIFESDSHGYNTRDYKMIDKRLGTNEDFKELCDMLHKEGIRVILDGVFNHVGRGFEPFLDVLKNREASRYKDWFHINFGGNSNYNDGLWYEGWEGNFDLVKLNLRNPEVKGYLLDCVGFWMDYFGIDGLRLDVAYMVDRDFLKELRSYTTGKNPEFFLAGEILGGDYKTIMNPEMCHSATNYECYKGIYSSLNSHNLFEIVHSLKRQFGPEDWTLYKGAHLISFVDNHDVSRIASILSDKRHIPIAFAIMCTIPGFPMFYYGSEWGVEGHKVKGEPGDVSLRPHLPKPLWNELTDAAAGCIKAFSGEKALQYGSFRDVVLENEHCIYERSYEGERILVAVNITDNEWTAHFDAGAGRAEDLITGETFDFGGGLRVPSQRALILKPY